MFNCIESTCHRCVAILLVSSLCMFQVKLLTLRMALGATRKPNSIRPRQQLREKGLRRHATTPKQSEKGSCMNVDGCIPDASIQKCNMNDPASSTVDTKCIVRRRAFKGSAASKGSKRNHEKEDANRKHRAQKKYKYEPKDTRLKVDPEAHTAIWMALLEWQVTNYNGGSRPSHCEWYWDLRCKLIDKKLLSRSHCWDVCRNSVRDHLKRTAAEVKHVDPKAQPDYVE